MQIKDCRSYHEVVAELSLRGVTLREIGRRTGTHWQHVRMALIQRVAGMPPRPGTKGYLCIEEMERVLGEEVIYSLPMQPM